MKYNRSVVVGMVHGNFRACSNWSVRNECFNRAQDKLERTNSHQVFKMLWIANSDQFDREDAIIQWRCEAIRPSKNSCFLFISEEKTFNYMKKLNPLKSITLQVVLTTEKLRDHVYKPKVAPRKLSFGRVIHEIICPGCDYRYVGRTARNLLTRLQKHSRKNALVSKHFVSCHKDPKLVLSSFKILDNALSIPLLSSLEALYIRNLQPTLNFRDEFMSTELHIRLKWVPTGITVWYCYETIVFQA